MKVQQYGCFVALDSRTQALVHVSELAVERVRDPAMLFKAGDRMDVKVLDKNQKGQLRLSRCDLFLVCRHLFHGSTSIFEFCAFSLFFWN